MPNQSIEFTREIIQSFSSWIQPSNILLLLSAIISGFAVRLSYLALQQARNSQTEILFKNTFDTLLEQYRIELNKLNNEVTSKKIFRTINKIFDVNTRTINPNKAYIINKPDYINIFLIVYRVLKLIDESKLEDKRNFSAIMRAIIPNNFLWLISINCLHTQKTEQSNYFGEFKKLWSKHAMLEHIKLFYDFSPEEFEDITDDEFAELDIEKSNYKEYHINILIHFKEQFGQEVFGDGFNLKYFENEFKKQEAPFR